MWVHLLVIALLVYILWLVTKRRDSMYRPGRYVRRKLRNLRMRMRDANNAKSTDDLIAMYQAKMNRASSQGRTKLAAQYQRQIDSIRKSGTLQKYKDSLKMKIKTAKKAGRGAVRKMRGMGRKMRRGVQMQMPVGNYYFYFNTVPKGGPTGSM